MEIRRIGEGSFWIRGKKESIVVNPESDEMVKQCKSRVALYSQKRQLPVTAVEWVTIAGGGEYEIGGAEIVGINVGERDVIYTINIDNLSLGVLGELEEMPSEKKIERVGGVDLMLVELGGVIDAKTVMRLSKNWGANYVVPMGRAAEEGVIRFLDVADREGVEPVDVLRIERDELPDGLEIVIFK